jgi:hypothetical protein
MIRQDPPSPEPVNPVTTFPVLVNVQRGAQLVNIIIEGKWRKMIVDTGSSLFDPARHLPGRYSGHGDRSGGNHRRCTHLLVNKLLSSPLTIKFSGRSLGFVSYLQKPMAC